MPVTACMSSFAGRLPGDQQMTGEPKTWSLDMFGRLPVYAWYGVIVMAVCGRWFFRYTACMRAQDQYCGPS
jgi:hypothetical protein